VKFLLAARFPKPPAKFTPEFVQLASGDMSNTQLGISPVSWSSSKPQQILIIVMVAQRLPRIWPGA